MINTIDGLKILLLTFASITSGRSECDYNALQLPPNTIGVSENTAIGYVLFNVTSTVEVIVQQTPGETNCNFLVVKHSSTQQVFNIALNKTIDAETLSTICRFTITCVNAPSSVEFSVKIIDINEYPPDFNQNHYTVNISESTKLNTSIFETEGIAKDKDKENQYILYKLQDGWGHFRLVDRKIYTTKQFDYDEMQKQFNLTIIAEEDGDNPVKKTSSVILTVDIIDVDDQSPRFTHTIYRLNISEGIYDNQAVNTTPPILAIDHDSFNSPVNYTITTGGDGIFTILQTGELVINGRLVRNENPSLALGIQAFQIDRPTDRLDGAAVIITVQDVNDHHPIMTNDTYTASVDEGSFGDFTIIQVTASDSDIGINSVFQFLLSGTEIFEIETVNDVGSIRLARGKMLDREEKEVHNFEVYAKELATELQLESNRSLVQITVNDINDNKPIFYPRNQQFSFTVNKTAKIGDIVGKVFANDSDKGRNGEVRYQLLQAGDEFSMNDTTGQILVNKPLIKRTGIINVQILAKDLPLKITDTRQTIQSGVITIVDVNIGPPIVTNLNSTISIPEDIPIHTIIYTVEATDPDITDGNNLFYYIVSPSSYGPFIIDSKSGTMKTNQTLDRETKGVYRLLIVVSDGSKNSSHGYLTIDILDINDNNPIFELPEYNFTILEGSEQLIGKPNPVNATDLDDDLNALLTYSLLTPRGTPTPIQINNKSGLLSTTRKLDREEKDVYDLYIMATDGGTPKRTSAVPVVITVLDINDNSPIFPQTNISLSFPEDSYPGCFYKAMATDRDIGEYRQIFYTTNDAGIIEVGSNGDVCVKDNQSLPLGLISLTIIAYNTQPYIRCLDCNNATLYLLIDVMDVNNNVPIFDQSYYNFSLDEGLKTQPNLRVHAKDNDTTSLYHDVLYSIVTDIDNTFTIDSITGQINFNTVPDYETKKIFQLTIGARNTGQSEVQTAVNVTIHINDVNDNHPVFSEDKYECTVYENQTSGLIPDCQVTATDKDYGNNQKIFYSILENVPFSIDTNTGNVSVNGGLDYDNGSRFYTIRIEASDNGSPKLTKFTQMVIQVINTNDNAPTFKNTPYNFTILEIQPAGSLVGVISAVDVDQDDIIYTMITNIEDFSITDRGAIYTKRYLDMDISNAISRYNLTINVSDGLYTSTTFSLVTVHPVNEYSPRFIQTFFGNVSENSARNTAITQVKAVDDDLGVDGEIHYSLTDEATLDIFKIDNSSGILTLNCDSCLDFTTKSVYEVIVQAIDGGTYPRLSFTTVEVTVQNVNDKAPRFSSGYYSVTLEENTSINTTIFRVVASDDDTPMDQLTFDLLNHREQFTLTGSNVVVKSPVDGDLLKHPSLVLNITVSDGSLSAYTLINVTIIDVNEYPPVLVLPNNRSWSLSLPENVTVGHEVVTIGASDQDFSNSGFTFWLTNEDDKFKINLSSGLLQVTNRFDRSIKDSYNVTVHVSDHGIPPLFSEQDMYIEILDSNTAPVFDNASYSFSVVESVNIGFKVGAVKATDKDYGSSGQVIYDIISGNIGSTFRINSSNGHILTDNLLNYEIMNYYKLIVEAKDMSSISKSSTVIVEIEVRDVFEAPKWPATLPIHYVSKSKECEASQITAISSDASSSDNGTSVIYNLLTFNDFFQMDNKTGALQPASDINSGNYTLVLQACNNRNILLCSNATLNVIVTEQVRLIFCPVFVPVNVPEDMKLNTTITIMNTTLDEERNQFYIIEGNDGHFSLGLDNGILKLNKELDRETVDTYTLSIKAVNLNNSQTATAQVIIRVTDVNDCPPYFPLKTYYGEIKEDASKGEDVFLAALNRRLMVEAKDNDLNPQLSYSLKPPSDYFNITIDTALITLARELDRENISIFNFEVIVTDRKFTNSTKVEIKVLDVNDVFPVFDHQVYNKSVFENTSTNSVILMVQATDQDISDRDSLTYKLISNVSNFEIDTETGELQVITELDRETKSEYNFSIVAFDTAGHNATTEVYIKVLDVNDNSPKFYQNVYNFSVQEGYLSVNKSFMVEASDDDIDENSRLKFRISKGNTGDFLITSFDNRANITIVKALDREKQGLEYINGIAIYKLIVEVTDAGEASKTGLCEINIQVSDINDNPPRFENSPLKYVGTVEETSASGTPVVLEPALSVTDEDYGINGVGGLVYSLSPVSLPFAINNITGEVTVALTGNMTLDRETKAHYDLLINVQDHGKLNASKKLSITVLDKNDEAPQFVQAQYSFNVSEDSRPSTSVGLVSAFDKDNDGNSSVRYILSDNGDGRFFIDGLTGIIRVAGGLDREIQDTYVLKVVAEDQSGYTGTASVDIQIEDANDESPQFTHDIYNFSVPENMENITIGNVNATDRDIGFNGQLTFNISDPVFSIDQNGSITLRKMFDRENITEYNLIVTVHDNGKKRQLTATSTVVISIIDINDNVPVFCLEHTCPIYIYNTTIVNELPEGSFVFLVTANDPDFDRNGTVSYRLTGVTSELFEIGHNNGLIKNKEFDLNHLEARGFLSNNGTSTPTIRLEIVAVDGGGRNQIAYLDISILVIEAEVLKFNQTSYKLEIHENKPEGTTVGNVSAYLGNITDVKLTYSVFEGAEDDTNFFAVGSTSGIIKTKEVLNRELNDKYLFVIKVLDDRNPQQTAFTQVYVTVVDENDYTPKFDQSSYSQSIVENISNITVVSVTARDLDSGENGDVRYTIVQGNQGDMFLIDEKTGDLNLAKPANREEEDEYNIIMMASDLGLISLNSTVAVTILIEDENDNAPVISIDKTVIYVRESKRQVIQIIQINATDADSDLNGEVLYSILKGDKNVFQINPISGWLSTMRALLTQDETEYQLTILAYDLGQLPLNSSIDIIIRVINSTTPQFSRDTYSIDVYVGMKAGTILNLNLTAGTGHYDYHIVRGNLNGMFNINSTIGEISLVKDVKDQGVYSLEVEAVDLADKESKDTVIVIISARQPNVKFDEIEYKVSVKENLPKDFLVIDLNTTVEFEGISVMYTLEGDDDHFTIDRDNGSIFTNASLDREVTSQHILIVRVTSLIGSTRHKREAKSDTTRIIIRVDDENDNPPYFPYPSSILEISIPQSAKQNYHLTTLKAKDPDDGDDLNIEYRITTGDDQTFNIDTQSGKLTSLVDMTDIDKDQFNLVIQSIDTNSSLSSNLSLKIYVVPDGDRYILTGNITLPVFVNYQEMFLKNLSAILNMTVELDNVQPHAKIEDGKKVIDNDRTDVFIKAFYKPDNGNLVPWHVIQREVQLKKKAIEELFNRGQSFVTDATPIKITNDEGLIGIPEMTLLGLACAIFVGSIISIVIVIRSWKVQEAKQNKIQMALMARQKISRETTFSDTICDSDSAVMELDADSVDINDINLEKYVKYKKETENQDELKKRVSFRLFQDIESLNSEPMQEPELILTVTEEQEKTLEFGNETSDGDTLTLRDIILGKTAMDLAKEIYLANQNPGTDSAMSSSKSGEESCKQEIISSKDDYCEPISNVNHVLIDDQSTQYSSGTKTNSKHNLESVYETIRDVEDYKYKVAEESEDTDL